MNKIRRKKKTKNFVLFLIVISIFLTLIKRFSPTIFNNCNEISSTDTKIDVTVTSKDIFNNIRVYGTSNIDTSIKIAKSALDTSENVIMVSDENPLEGYIALPLSNMYDAPILLNGSENLDRNVKEEIRDLNASKIIIIGDETTISSNVEEQLINEGLIVDRIEGINLSDVSINIANKVGNSDKYFIVTEENLSDVMVVGSIAASEQIPIIILQDDYSQIYKFLKSKEKISCYFIGKNNAFYDAYSDLNLQIINTKDIYKANYNILTENKNNLDFSILVIASPENPASILCGGAICCNFNYPLIFAQKDNLYPYMEQFLVSNVGNIEKIFAIGDTSLISDDLLTPEYLGKTFYNAEKPLATPTYDNSNQAVHPKVIYMENGWNGYRYWMGITPYPNSNDKYENPQILVSNDGLNYKALEGCKSPLDIPIDVNHGGHYSDITLCLVNNVMEVYFRYNPGKQDGSGPNNEVNMIYRVKSVDGKIWSNKELMLSQDTFKQTYNYVCPIIIYSDNKYKLWFSNYSQNLYYTETTDWKNFDKVIKCNFKNKPSNFNLWHHDIIETDLGYELVINGYTDGDFSKQGLYYTFSKDGINFSLFKKILDVNPNYFAFDNKTLYKSSLVKLKDRYLLFYSAKNKSGKWRIGLAQNRNLLMNINN
ncbi:cell wall-binding repeat-containing protein [Clostridium sp.]|uniref:cell wall-binding repeat-containing protein n=1 Tax=Clostridium sp. TaxID=1506 RepID=UPI003218036B